MLAELTIRDFAIIDRLSVEFGPGFNVLTGETGAGKSIVIDALGATLGERTGSDVVRAGAQTARVDAAFDLSKLTREARARLDALFEEIGVPLEEDLLVLTREVSTAGRSTARIAGRLSPVGSLQRVGELLVDIHGQSDHISLVRPAEQLNLLDRWAGVSRAEMTAGVARLRALRREATRLLADSRDLARRVDLLQFQIDEIRGANLSPGEDDELANEQRLLGSAEKLSTLAADAYERLSAARDHVARVAASLQTITSIDENAEDLTKTAIDVEELTEDLLRNVRSYRDQVEFNPERLVEVEARLVLIANLGRKYGATVDDMLAFAVQAEAELVDLRTGEERRTRITFEEAQERTRLAGIAAELSDRRREAAATLAKEVDRELTDLGFNRARFIIDVRTQSAPDGLALGGSDPVAYDETGIDRVEFLLAANPGEPPKTLAKVASGGEQARIMLALKSVLGRVDALPTLVFDEVDVGIGGLTANVVGSKLWGLTDGHQVICITHLPQVASFADHHLRIVKLTSGDRAGVRIEALDDAGKRTEIADMMGGASRATEQGAAELLSRADAWKQTKALARSTE